MNCLHCNKAIESRRNTKKYCSNTCKQYAYLHRNGTPNSEKTQLTGVVALNSNTNVKYEKEIPSKTPPLQQEGVSGYKKIRPKIWAMLDHPKFPVDYYSEYFSTRIGGRIRPDNFRAFGYVCKRLRCIIENLFGLCYKRKVHFNTIHHLRKALQETLCSDQMKQLPNDFPFMEELLNLYRQLGELEQILKQNKEGIKFTLEKNKIALYANMLRILREFTVVRQPFVQLFPHFFKS